MMGRSNPHSFLAGNPLGFPARFVDLIDLCNSKSALPLTPVEMRALLDPSSATTRISNASQPFKLKQRLGDETCDEIVHRYESGETAQILADEFKVAKSALLVLLRSRSVIMRRRAVTEEQTAHLAEGYARGKTIAALEQETGIAHGSIQRALKAAGVQLRPRGFQPNASDR
jgi:hypothetical protein